MIARAAGFVNGAPRGLLRAEGFAIALAAIVAFSRCGASWGLFAALILLPDVSILFYFTGPRVGALAYNSVHVYFGPIILFGAAAVLAAPTGIAIALIWTAHIGVDRLAGYGLKYNDSFTSTHLGRVGRQAQE